MKFYTNSIKSCTARIGKLTEFNRIPNSNFETPLVLVYTKVKFNVYDNEIKIFYSKFYY